jgi:predicted CoA-substrate-specific enzyme activase
MADAIYTMGVDIGSTTSKCVILKDGTKLLSQAIIPSGTGTSGPARAISSALELARTEQGQIACTGATGYGRKTLPLADFQMSELSCHARGARFLFPQARTVIDIGGQDAKALQLGPDGGLLNFVMNDKCAAGTGRFLEVMARVLELDLSRLAEIGAKAEHPAMISSTCTVFAESEVISQLSQNVAIPDIVAGIHRSVAVRAAGLVRRLPVVPDVVMTGGVARNGGVVHALEDELETKIQTSPLSQLAGAIGAALFALDKTTKE